MKKLILLGLSLFLLHNPVEAAFKFGAALPTRYILSDASNGLYSLNGSHSGKATGYNFYTFLPLLPGLGYETYSIEIQGTNLTEDSSLLKLQLYDIILDFSDKNSSLYLGFGEGMTSFECKATSCASLSFSGRRARQIFVSYGVPMGEASDFNLSLRRISAKVAVNNGGADTDLDLSGWLLAFGMQVGF